MLVRPRRHVSAAIKVTEADHYLKQVGGVTLTKVIVMVEIPFTRIVVKGVRQGISVVAFLKAPDYTRAMILLGEMVNTRALTWHRDKFKYGPRLPK